jgi:hypothetical protein
MPAPAPANPLDELMAQYSKLEAAAPAAPMYTPEQQQERISRNNSMTALGLLGGLSGDKGLQGVGGSIFQQALADNTPKITTQGITDPLTGINTPNPDHLNQLREQQKGRILQQVLAYQGRQDQMNTQRDIAQMRVDASRDNVQARIEGAQALKAMAGAVGAASGGGSGKAATIVTDPATGKQFYVDRYTQQTLGPVLGLPENSDTHGQPLVKPQKMSGPDDKQFSALNTQEAAVAHTLEAVQKAPDAFGAMKGMPNQIDGPFGTALRTIRDAKLTTEQVQARALVYNELSAIIKERAGTAQSKQELARLNSFLPADTDSAKVVTDKLMGYQQYLKESKMAIAGRYAGQRPTEGLPGSGSGGSSSASSAAPSSPSATPAVPAPTGSASTGWAVIGVKP